ncbi:hypothetical protein GE061_017160 [Apolygus lucorum]|uniref:Uncharacterized protein n=1 Tax=Apolygus lucorum TaxID=248454 RepID=A0A8S9XI78_APOLU|nr:hypothetical protein GE061_017160 [Apolygus lucorum]
MASAGPKAGCWKYSQGYLKSWESEKDLKEIAKIPVQNNNGSGPLKIKIRTTMEHFPLLPGYSFQDSTRTQFSVPHKLEYKNGYPIVKANPVGLGGGTLDVESVRYTKNPAPGL